MLFKQNGVAAFIGITFIEGYRHCARAHAVPIGFVIPEYGQGHLLFFMVGDRDDVILIIHLACRGIRVFGSVRQYFLEHIVGLHSLHSFCIVMKRYRNRPGGELSAIILLALIKCDGLLLCISPRGHHVHLNTFRDRIVYSGLPYFPYSPVRHGRYMGITCRKSLRILSILVLHIPIRNGKFIAIHVSDGQGILADVIEIRNVLKDRILLRIVRDNPRLSSCDGFTLTYQ